MSITHIFFDLHGTLVDSARMSACYATAIGRVMSERYGGSADAWEQANRLIVADWDSYFADLDLDGDEGINDLWEGELRVTRALFRLTATPEPNLDSLLALSRELPFLGTRNCDAFYSDAKTVVEYLHKAGYVLGIATHAISSQARGTLEGAGMAAYFEAPLLCPDVVGRFQKDAAFFLAASVPPEQCLVVDDSLNGIRGAKAAGMQTIRVCRDDVPSHSLADAVLAGDLYGLLEYLEVEVS